MEGHLINLRAHPAVAEAVQYTTATGKPALRAKLHNGRQMGVLTFGCGEDVAAEMLLNWANERG